MRLVFVEWLDSSGSTSEWQSLADYKPASLRCQSVGWLAHDGPDSKTIFPHVGIDVDGVYDQGCGSMIIPAVAITRLIDLSIP